MEGRQGEAKKRAPGRRGRGREMSEEVREIGMCGQETSAKIRMGAARM